MNIETIGTLIQGIATVVALSGVAVTFWLQQRSHNFAETNASRAEAAARLTEEYTRRVVDALEAIAARGAGVSASTTPPPRVSWSLVHSSGDTYRLTNEGDAVADAVHVASHDSLQLLGFQGGPDLGPGEALTFLAAVDLATSDLTVSVEWADTEGGERKRWRYPLPRPARR